MLSNSNLVSQQRFLDPLALLTGSEDQKEPHAATEETATDQNFNISLRSLNAVSAYLPFIEEARAKVTADMENMVLSGLTSLVCPRLHVISNPHLVVHLTEPVTHCVFTSSRL